MRIVSDTMTERWQAEVKSGDARPVVRATIQNVHQRRWTYNTADAPGGDFGVDRDRNGTFTSVIFGTAGASREIRNIRSLSWNRSVDQDVAEGSLVLLNTDLTPLGNPVETIYSSEFDQPGHFTYNRGDTTVSANRWGYTDDTGWNGRIVPDRLIRTYEGYGFDDTMPPAYDDNLMISGTWLADEVTYRANGDIEIAMRDVGRLLIDQIAFPPVVPLDDYPMTWSKIRSESVKGKEPTGGNWRHVQGTASSSNDYYIGQGITDTPMYVGPTGGVQGHFANDARADDYGHNTYWYSTGQDSPHGKVWWQVDFAHAKAMNALRLQTFGGPYRIFISVGNDDHWFGRRKIPYEVTTEGVNLHAGIPFVQQVVADRGVQFDVILKKTYPGVTRVRLTFARLKPFGHGKYPYHAGLKDFQAYVADNAGDLDLVDGTHLKVVGNYHDFSNIIKWLGAWAGWFWPEHSTGDDYMFLRDGNEGGPETYTYPDPDTALPRGRVWGDFMFTGTSGEADLTPDQFDKQPLMDVISHIRDIVGFNFWIDETGAMVWRLPNYWSLGNYLTPHHLTHDRTRGRTTDHITLDEEVQLKDYTTTLSSRNLRDQIFVGNTTGKIGTVIKGFNPYPAGFRRTAGWTDQHWATKQECRVAADMIAARSMFTYRVGSVTISGYPAIQIDDQVRILERVTNETFFHYVTGISSENNMEAGTWNYVLSTHWLGERPSDAWVVRVDELDGATQTYLNAISG